MKLLALLVVCQLLPAQGVDVVWMLDGTALRGTVAVAGSTLVVAAAAGRPQTVKRGALLAWIPAGAPLALTLAVEHLRAGEPGAAARFAALALDQAAALQTQMAARYVLGRARICLGHDAAAESALSKIAWPQQDGPLALDALHWCHTALARYAGAPAAAALLLRATRHEAFARLEQDEAVLLRLAEATALGASGALADAEALLEKLFAGASGSLSTEQQMLLAVARVKVLRAAGVRVDQALQRLRAFPGGAASREAALLEAEDHCRLGRPEQALHLMADQAGPAHDARNTLLCARATLLLAAAGEERLRLAGLAQLRSCANRCEDPLSAGSAARLLRGDS